MLSRSASKAPRVVGAALRRHACSPACGCGALLKRSLSTASSAASRASRGPSNGLLLSQRGSAASFRPAAALSALPLASFRAFSSSSLPEHIVLTMPALSPTMEKGNLASWKKKVGEKVKVGEEMAEVETDKATVAFESTEEGFIAAILVPDGSQDVAVNTEVAILVENEEDVAAFKDFKQGGGKKEEKKEKKSEKKEEKEEKKASHAHSHASSSSPSSSANGERLFASPAAKKLAQEEGINLSSLSGTGPNSRILAADVKEFAAEEGKKAKTSSSSSSPSSPAPSAPSSGDFTDLPNSNIRKVIAQRLLQSKQSIPHYYLTSEVQVDALLSLRERLNKESEKKKDNVKLSVNDFIVKAAALACKKVPQVNSSWQETFIRQFDYVDVSVAVSTPTGLLTPIVKDADLKGLSFISQETKALAAKAREGKLQPSEFNGGTFTISNLGMFGVKSFSAIINPPQAAILAVGSAEKKLVLVDEKGENGEAKQVLQSANFLSVTLSCDHRVVDGAVGAQWLQAFKGYVEKPITMLL